jgi:hypothetical protein
MALNTEKKHYYAEHTIDFLVEALSDKEACQKVAEQLAPLIFDYQKKHEEVVRMDQISLVSSYRVNLDHFGDEGYEVTLSYDLIGNPKKLENEEELDTYAYGLVSDSEIEELAKHGVQSRRFAYGDGSEVRGVAYDYNYEDED